MTGIMRIIVSVGEAGRTRSKTVLAIFGLMNDTVLCMMRSKKERHHFSRRQFVDQVLFTGVDAFVLVGLIGFICGITISIQAMTNMPDFGIGEYFGSIMVIAIIRELGPFFTSLVVIGRSGAALAAYIGNMKANKEITALEVMGIDLTVFLVVPAFIGMIISLICLTIYFDIIAIVGGLFLSKILVSIDFYSALVKVVEALTLSDVIVSLLKNVLFGGSIALISCYYGLLADCIRLVPRSVYRAIVVSLVVTLLLNAVITVSFYMIVGFHV